MVSVLIRLNNEDAIVQDFSLLTLVIFLVISTYSISCISTYTASQKSTSTHISEWNCLQF